MANRANPRFGACCMTPNSCDACEEKLPRYLCFRADISTTSGTGSGTGTGTGTGTAAPCCTSITTRLTPMGGEHCGWQSPELKCSDGSGNMGYITVEILRDRSTGTGTGSGTGTGTPDRCVTRVTSTDLTYVIDFPGVLPDGMTFTINHENIQYDCEVFTASMVPNPSAYEACAPCECVTCLPSTLCLYVVKGDKSGVADATWDCETRSWTGVVTVTGGTGTGTGTDPEDVYGVTLRMASAADNVGCVILGSVGQATGTGTAQEFQIVLEDTGVGGPDIRGVTCAEGGGSVLRGKPNYETHTLQTIVSHTEDIVQSTGSGTGSTEVVGTLTITDKSCGQICGPDCENVPVQTTCCIPLTPATLYGTVSDDFVAGLCDCDVTGSPVFRHNGADRWVSDSFTVCGHTYQAELVCEFNPVYGRDTWVCYLVAGCYAGDPITSPIAAIVGPSGLPDASCSPLLLDFYWGGSLVQGSTGGLCCTPISPPGPFDTSAIRMIITA